MSSIALFAILLPFAHETTLGEEPAYIPDPQLKAAIERTLKTNDPTMGDMLKLINLGADGAGITDLSGIECAENLEIVTLSRNSITDISPLLNLTKLKWIDLSSNLITHIPELSWDHLDCLLIYNNPLGDLEALSNRFTAQQMWVVLYEGNRHPDLTPPSTGTATNENNEIVEIPPAVWDKICEHTLGAFQTTFYETFEPKTFTGVFGAVSRGPMPHGEHFYLYIHCCPITAMYSFTAILAYDRENNRVSSTMASLADEDIYLIRGPRISFEDLDLDGWPELVTKDADHFGTQADWICTTYWHIDDDLSFEPVFRLKTYATTGIPVPPYKDGQERYYCIVAFAEAVGPDTIVVTTSLASDDETRIPEQVIGRVVFEMDHTSSTFKATEETLLLDEHSKLLRRTNPLEYGYTCSNPDCGMRTVVPEYSGDQIKCPRCGGPCKAAGTVIRRHKD